MAWTPTKNVFDERPVKNNLIAYFEEHQADALVWANDGTALPVIRKFHKTPRLVTVFPALTFLQSENRDNADSDLVDIDYAILLELAIVHGNQDECDLRAKRYAMALGSMLANVPGTILLADSIITPVTAVFSGMQTQFDVQGKYNNQFIDVFQVRTGWNITSSLFS